MWQHLLFFGVVLGALNEHFDLIGLLHERNQPEGCGSALGNVVAMVGFSGPDRAFFVRQFDKNNNSTIIAQLKFSNYHD